jgi:hypothetical protein
VIENSELQTPNHGDLFSLRYSPVVRAGGISSRRLTRREPIYGRIFVRFFRRPRYCTMSEWKCYVRILVFLPACILSSTVHRRRPVTDMKEPPGANDRGRAVKMVALSCSLRTGCSWHIDNHVLWPSEHAHLVSASSPLHGSSPKSL